MRKIRKLVKKTCIEKGNISLLNYEKIKKQFHKKLLEVLDVYAPKFLGRELEICRVLRACDGVCGKKGMRCEEDIWRWNEEMKRQYKERR